MKFSLCIVTISLKCDCELDRTISSIRAQVDRIFASGVSVRHLIVSPDASCSIYSNRYTTFIQRGQHGIYDAMNCGLDHADEDLIWFLNGGDLLLDVQPITEISDAFAFDIFGFSVVTDDSGGALIRPKLTSPHPGTIYNRLSLGDMRFDSAFGIAADRDFFDRCREKRFRIKFNSEPIAIFMTNGVSSKQLSISQRLRAGWYEFLNRPTTPLRLWRVIRILLG